MSEEKTGTQQTVTNQIADINHMCDQKTIIQLETNSDPSDGSRINLLDPPDLIRKKIGRCKTDSFDGIEVFFSILFF